MRRADFFNGQLIGFGIHQNGWQITSVKCFIIGFHGPDIFKFGNKPKRVKALRLGQGDGRASAQLREHIMDFVEILISFWVNQRFSKLLLHIHFTLPFPFTNSDRTHWQKQLFLGRFSDLLVEMWGGTDIIVDPYTNAKKTVIAITAPQMVDVNVRHPQSFKIFTSNVMPPSSDEGANDKCPPNCLLQILS